MEQVMQTFDDTKAWNLPVVDEEGRYQGFVSKSKIFNSVSYTHLFVDRSRNVQVTQFQPLARVYYIRLSLIHI